MPENTKADTEEISLQLDKILDECGFSKERVKERTLSMDKSSKAKCLSTQRILQRSDIVKIFVGSLREGTGIYYHSDCDILQIYTSVLCIEQEEQSYDQSKTLFQIEGDTTPAGHYLLRLIHPSQIQHTSNDVNHAFEEIEENWYLSSDKFMEKNDDVFATGKGWIPRSTSYQERRGPSIPKYTEPDILWQYIFSSNDLTLSMDFVRGLPCVCPSIIKRWKERFRHHQWPSQSDIEIAASMPACVVPVGQKGSELEHLQWRVCFTWAEMHLIKSMSNTQTKIHFILKTISRYYLKPVCEQMTSYIVKNVMLWQAEEKPIEDFQSQHILDRTSDALKFLRNCLRKRQLENYMMPERNLLAGISDEDRSMLLDKTEHLLTNLQPCICSLIICCDQRPATVSKIPESLHIANYLERRMFLEMSLLSVTKLAEYYVELFYHRWYWYSVLYNITFITTRCVLKFGLAIYNDPLGIEHEKLINCYHDLKDDWKGSAWEIDAVNSQPKNVDVSADTNSSDGNECQDAPKNYDIWTENTSRMKDKTSAIPLKHEETNICSKTTFHHKHAEKDQIHDKKTDVEKGKSEKEQTTKAFQHSPKPNKSKSLKHRKNKHKRQQSISKKKQEQIPIKNIIHIPNELTVTPKVTTADVFIEAFWLSVPFLIYFYRTGADNVISTVSDPLGNPWNFLILIAMLCFTVLDIRNRHRDYTEQSFKVKLTKKLKRCVKRKLQQGRCFLLSRPEDHQMIEIFQS